MVDEFVPGEPYKYELHHERIKPDIHGKGNANVHTNEQGSGVRADFFPPHRKPNQLGKPPNQQDYRCNCSTV